MAQAPTFIVIAHYYFIYLLPESIYLLPCAAVNFPPLAFHLTHFLFLFVVAVFSFYLQVLILPRSNKHQHLDNYQTIRGSYHQFSSPQCATR
jgi:hypothetical protein